MLVSLNLALVCEAYPVFVHYWAWQIYSNTLLRLVDSALIKNEFLSLRRWIKHNVLRTELMLLDFEWVHWHAQQLHLARLELLLCQEVRLMVPNECFVKLVVNLLVERLLLLGYLMRLELILQLLLFIHCSLSRRSCLQDLELALVLLEELLVEVCFDHADSLHLDVIVGAV